MQLTVSACLLGLVSLTVANAQPSGPQSRGQQERIVNQRYHFSVTFPKGWFVFEGGDLPSFYNFPEEKLLPQGNLPKGGASIIFLAQESGQTRRGEQTLPAWVEKRVRIEVGSSVQRKEFTGPTAVEVSTALRVEFDQLPLGLIGKPLHSMIVAWQLGGELFGVELTYFKDDPHGSQYERVLLDIARSFKQI